MWLLWIDGAWASAGGGEEVSMMPLLWGLLLLSLAYLSTHFVVERLQKKFLFSSGAEYIALGIGLSYMAVFKNASVYLPAITFAVGWVGLTYGMNIDLRKLLRSGSPVRLALTETIVVGFGIAAMSTIFLREFSSSDPKMCLACGAMLGTAALSTSHSAIEVIEKRFKNII